MFCEHARKVTPPLSRFIKPCAFSSSQNGINIAQYLSTGQWNTIELGSTRLGRIDATVFVQALMGT